MKELFNCLSIALAPLFAATFLSGCNETNQNQMPPRTKAEVATTSSLSSLSFRERLAGFQWKPETIPKGKARIDCDIDFAKQGTGKEITDISFVGLLDHFDECGKSNMLHIYWNGDIDSDFAELMERTSELAIRSEIEFRVLEIESGGGDVIAAMRAGDAIGSSSWGVRTKINCYSACVLILAAADHRNVSGKVGIHRIFPPNSSAQTREQLNEELGAIHFEIRNYLKKNGASTALADEMMTVASDNIRILTSEELDKFGLSGSNAAQSDIDRLKLIQACGAEFVDRREKFLAESAVKCHPALAPGRNYADKKPWLDRCFSSLEAQYKLPDPACPQDPSHYGPLF